MRNAWVALLLIAAGCTGDDDDAGGTLAVTLSRSGAGIPRSGSVGVRVTLPVQHGGDATITASGLPAGATADPLSIPAAATEGTLWLRASASAVPGAASAATVTAHSSAGSGNAPFAAGITPESGTLDDGFGVAGVRVQDLGNGDSALSVALSADGKILAGGSSGTYQNLAVARFDAAGALDLSYGGGDGVATTPAAFTATFEDILLQPDGKLLAGGFVTSVKDYVIARYDAEGVLDPGFATGGMSVTPFAGDADSLTDMALLPDGRVLAVGYDSAFLVVRYDGAGVLDGSFGSGGVVHLPVGGPYESSALAVAIRPDGKAVVAGTGRIFSPNEDLALAVLDDAGNPDPAFGTGGTVLHDFGFYEAGAAVAIQSDGRIVVGGSGGPTPATFAVFRFEADGTPDVSFGIGGQALVPLPDGGVANEIAIQDDGRIVATGYQRGFLVDFVTARFEPDGTLDSSFGTDGVAITDFGSDLDFAFSLAIQPDGKIVAAGRSSVDGSPSTALVRYWP